MQSLDGTRVVVADDQAFVRRALRDLIEDEGGSLVGEASNANAAVEVALAQRPDLVVLDYRMGATNGLDAARVLRIRLPHARVVMLTASNDPVLRARAVELGVFAFVVKGASNQMLLDALRAAAMGSSPEPVSP
jgi:DNA-binding NarL/FixJ family response regulator